MKSKLLIILLSLTTVGSLIYAGISQSNNKKINNEVRILSKKSEKSKKTILKLNQKVETLSSETKINKVNEDIKSSDTYESVLNEYKKKLEGKAPILVNEYNAEYPTVQTGVDGLAELSNTKIENLASISNEGVYKMAEIMYASAGSYSDYESWSKKLIDVYTQEAQKIIDAYLASANIKPDNISISDQEVNAQVETTDTVNTKNSQQEVKEVVTEEVKPEYYNVQGGDNIYRIAVNNGLTTEQLKEMNGLSGNETEVGQVLRIK
ncbi:LysM peptidoglycan-binding domain-containing protein [uncultured Vagococcus sp.]|uniref:LysM peptidoglycan-binding domain-containing protein n=1 Tax=uncultured Vagococcus sp. TaxID=189676 RepID=UPI0028D5C101|nr:LysM peptidoglycan-binding domain-containing protein [uncultured Vagococcus sp.]